ncbi:MAG: hypothetical protein Q8851_00440 [Sweet potato little leaf phytoplasma]|nr:hypothetical protein [Sweet potato little leaf phytoplasma]
MSIKREKYFEIIQLLDQIMTNFESNGHFLKVFYETKFSEDFINSYIADHFKNIGKKTDRESIKGHGKVDVLVDYDYIIETKNYYNQEDLEFVYKQVLHRIHHRFLYASIVLLVNGFQKNKFNVNILDHLNLLEEEKQFSPHTTIFFNNLKLKKVSPLFFLRSVFDIRFVFLIDSKHLRHLTRLGPDAIS